MSSHIDWEEISICSDLQSEHDFGNLSIICRLEKLLSGIPVHGSMSYTLLGKFLLSLPNRVI